MRHVGSMGLVLVLVAAGLGVLCARAQGPAEDPFLKGLQERGLATLVEAYLKPAAADREKEGAAPETAAKEGSAPEAGGNEALLAALTVQKAMAATNLKERQDLFAEARRHYEGAIAAGEKAMSAVPAGREDERNKIRMETLELRLALAKMMFEKWLKGDLDLLEMTDRRGGDRALAIELLRAAMKQYEAAAKAATVWLSEMDRLDPKERLKVINTGYLRGVQSVRRNAELGHAWTLYYLGWALPADSKPADGERPREDLLNDAITAFQVYTTMPDKVSAKWYAYLVIGMASRELGKYEAALESLALAENPLAPEPLRIQIGYERALTLLRKGNLAAARKAIEEARQAWKEKLDTELHGLAMPLLEAEVDIAEGEKNKDPALKQKGIALLESLHERPNPWPAVVQWVMSALVGATVDVEKMEPFQVWMMAGEALSKAQEHENAKDLERAADLFKRAADLFKVYAEKAGPHDKNYAEAVYKRAACLLKLGKKTEAAALFRQVAEESPGYQYAAMAANYYVGILGEVYDKEKTDENREAYESALGWFVSKWIESNPDQQFYYGLALYQGKKYAEASAAFSRVSEKAEHYLDARYWIPLCGLEALREKTLATGDKTLILGQAREVAQSLVAFAEFALKAEGVPEEKKPQLRGWAEAAYINAADVYLYGEVELPVDALRVLDTMEKTFELDDEARGRVLKLRIDALQKLGRFAEAQQSLETFLKIAKPEDVGPVLKGLFRAMIEDVKELVRRGQKEEAAKKVDQAKVLGNRLKEWLEASDLPDKAERIEANRYDLAELYLAVGNHLGALTIYQEIGGPKVETVQPLKVDCIYGMARAYEGLGEESPGGEQAKQHFERALELWRVLLEVAEGERDQPLLWDRRYHVFYVKNRLGQTAEVRESLKSMQILYGTLGGGDPVLQKKFRDLLSQVLQGG